MTRRDPPSEYELRGTEEAAVFPRGPEALRPGDRQRLRYLTGQDVDPSAPIDRANFYGVIGFESDAERDEYFRPQTTPEPDPEEDRGDF